MGIQTMEKYCKFDEGQSDCADGVGQISNEIFYLSCRAREWLNKGAVAEGGVLYGRCEETSFAAYAARHRLPITDKNGAIAIPHSNPSASLITLAAVDDSENEQDEEVSPTHQKIEEAIQYLQELEATKLDKLDCEGKTRKVRAWYVPEFGSGQNVLWWSLG